MTSQTRSLDKFNNNGQRIQNKPYGLYVSTETVAEDDNELASNPSRRQILAQSAVSAFASLMIPNRATADDDKSDNDSSYPYNTQVSFGASWSAVDGLNEMDLSNRNDKVVGFDMKAYKAMRDDPTRTPVFEKAIKERLYKSKNPESQVVLDLGTGPFALFAMMAADVGAGKVYAIEGNPEAAASARYTVKKAGYEDVITVIEGLSTEIQLPEKVDFCVAELVGSIGSEEGVYATVKDAARFLKEPSDADNWIPSRIQTYGAPASYTLHNLFGPPEFDWTKLGGEPVRFRCSDNGLQLLSDPQVIEDISFASATDKSKTVEEGTLTFRISADRIGTNAKPLFEEFKQRSDAKSSQQYAETTSHSLSGIAMWPRLFLNDDLIIDSRNYPLGGHQKSHWQTVLPIMAGRPMGLLRGGEIVEAKYKFQLPLDVTKPPKYSIQGVLKYNS